MELTLAGVARVVHYIVSWTLFIRVNWVREMTSRLLIELAEGAEEPVGHDHQACIFFLSTSDLRSSLDDCTPTRSRRD